MNEEKKQLRSRRINWLCWYLTTVVVNKLLHAQHVKQAGFRRNAAMEALVTKSVQAALGITDAAVVLPQNAELPAFVASSTNSAVEYTVFGVGKPDASCSCAYFQRGNLCKHIIKVGLHHLYHLCAFSSMQR